MDCRPPGSSVQGGSPGKNSGVGCHASLQGIFPTQGLNPGLPHGRWIFLSAKTLGKPKNSGVGAPSLLQGIFPNKELNWGHLHCRQILYQLSYQGSPSSPKYGPFPHFFQIFFLNVCMCVTLRDPFPKFIFLAILVILLYHLLFLLDIYH